MSDDARVRPRKPAFKRVLLKLSGEALQGPGAYGIDLPTLQRIAGEIRELRKLEVEVALVIGGALGIVIDRLDGITTF